MAEVRVSNEELFTVRDAMRGLNRLVDRLESGESEKFVLTQHNRMRAVVVSLTDFSEMQRRLEEFERHVADAHAAPTERTA